MIRYKIDTIKTPKEIVKECLGEISINHSCLRNTNTGLNYAIVVADTLAKIVPAFINIDAEALRLRMLNTTEDSIVLRNRHYTVMYSRKDRVISVYSVVTACDYHFNAVLVEE